MYKYAQEAEKFDPTGKFSERPDDSKNETIIDLENGLKVNIEYNTDTGETETTYTING
jgi:hypothetical protein